MVLLLLEKAINLKDKQELHFILIKIQNYLYFLLIKIKLNSFYLILLVFILLKFFNWNVQMMMTEGLFPAYLSFPPLPLPP